MVSSLQSIAAGLRAQPDPTLQIGDILRQQSVTNSNLATQDLQRQSIQQQMDMRDKQAQLTQQDVDREQALGQARYIDGLAKQLLASPEDQWGRILAPNLPQLEKIGYSSEVLQGMTRQDLMGVVQQMAPLVGSPESAKPVKLREGEILVDPTSGEEIASGREVIPEDKTQPMVDKLRSRYDDFTKDLRKTDAAFRKIETAPATAAGDMSLIFGYMKLLDPGSTVREGEFATAQNAEGIDGQIRNLYNRVISGERLNPEQRQDFKNTGKKAFDAQQESADSQIAVLLQQADQDGVDRAKVLGAEELRAFEKRAADRLIKSNAPPPPTNVGRFKVEVVQ